MKTTSSSATRRATAVRPGNTARIHASRASATVYSMTGRANRSLDQFHGLRDREPGGIAALGHHAPEAVHDPRGFLGERVQSVRHRGRRRVRGRT